MTRLSLIVCALLIGLSMIIATNGLNARHAHRKHLLHSNEPRHHSRQLIGDLLDTETNTVYTVDGHKQEDLSSSSDKTTLPTSAALAPPNHDEIACLAACHTCIEDYSVASRKRRAADNCGPMCDCADDCFIMPAEQVGKIYGQGSKTGNDNDCWWKTYGEMLNSGIPTSK